MADAPYIISDGEGIDFIGNNVQNAVSNDDSILNKKKYEDVNDLHVKLSHPSEITTQVSVKAMNFIMTGVFQSYEDCAMDKAKERNARNQPIEQSKVNGERLFMDISSPIVKSLDGNYQWLLILGDCSDNSWSYFLKEKSDLKWNVLVLIKELKAKYDAWLSTFDVIVQVKTWH